MYGNNIIIGLGGTGGNIIKFLKKRIELENKNEDIYVDYLYVDSNSDDLNDKASWKVFGRDFSLSNSNIVHLDYSIDINTIFTNPDYYKNITSWIGNKDDWQPILENFTSTRKVYGQQKRRLGRFLFASNVRKFRGSIKSIVTSLQKKSNTVNNTFYICSGLAGGTGSGSLIDTIVQVKELYPDSTILLYLFIPEGSLVGDKDTGNYYPNAYAALKELNDLSIGTWKPYNVFNGEKTQQTNFFKKACIITNENSKGVFLNPEQQKPEKLLADYIFYRIVGNTYYINKIVSLENSEPFLGGAEIVQDGNNRYIPVRSRDFMTFGMSRIIFPKEEIKEYLTYKASYSFILSILFNKRNDENFKIDNYINEEHNILYNKCKDSKKIFEDEDKNININEIIDDGFKSSIKFTEEVFTLQDGVLENEEYKPFRNEWTSILENIERGYSESNVNVKEKFKYISEQLSNYYNKSFREKDIGVEKFFRDAESDAERRAKGIVKLIEDKLFSEWLYLNNYSIKNCIEVVERFIELTKKHIKNLDKKIADTEKSIDFFFDEAEAHRVEFEQVGLLGSIVGKKEKIYSSYKNALVKYYIAKTELKGLNYAKVKLLPFVYMKLETLLMFMQTTKYNLEELKYELKKEFNREYILKHIKEKLINNEKKLSDSMTNIMQESNNILEKNIIDELNTQYANKDNELKELVKKTLYKASEYLPFNYPEVHRRSPLIQNCTIQDLRSVCLSIIPFSSEESTNNNFREVLKNTFDAQRNLYQVIEHVVDQYYQTYNNQDNTINHNEILIVKVTSTFPLRMVDRVKFLKDKYVEAHKNNPNIDMEIHIEGNRNDYNDLFIPDRGNYQEKSIVDLLILLATENLLKDDSGEYILDIRNEKGRVAHKITFSSNKIIALHKNLKYGEALKIKYESQKIIDNLAKLTYKEKSLEKEKILNNFKEIYNLIKKECDETGEDITKWIKLLKELENKWERL